jgi:hypothetical protein
MKSGKMTDLRSLWQVFQGRFFPRFILKKIMRKRIIEMETNIKILQKDLATIEELKMQCLENNLDEKAKELESTLLKIHDILNKSVDAKILLTTVLQRWE